MKRIFIGLFAVFAVLAALAVAPYAAAPMDFTVSPLAVVRVNGAVNYRHLGVRDDEAFAEVVGDGLVDSQYLAELPSGPDPAELSLEFDFKVTAARIVVIGAGEQSPGSVRARLELGGEPTFDRAYPWSPEEGRPPTLRLERPPEFDRLRLTFNGAPRTFLNNVEVMATGPRWRAWARFLRIELVSPWLAGALLFAAIAGWGRILGPAREDDPSFASAAQTLAGLIFAGTAALAWIPIARASPVAGWMGVGFGAAGAFAELRALFRGEGGARERWLAMAPLAALLLAATVIDTTLIAARRVKPQDHLAGYFEALPLLRGELPRDYWAFRPWLSGVISAPAIWASGRFGYPNYLGLVAWLNAASLPLLLPLLAKWSGGRTRAAAALLCLLPVWETLHFPGPRPLAAAVSLFALYCWLENGDARRWRLGGTAAAVACLLHPGSLFMFPFATVWLIARSRGSRAAALIAVAIPLAVHCGWTLMARTLYPEARNVLAYYPIQPDIAKPLPDEPLATLLSRISAADWSELAWHRVLHLRHYLWADNPWHNEPVELFRPVSLPSTLGLTGTAWLLFALAGAERRWLIGAALGPLLLLHLHIGQAFPQFHILPGPFLASAALVACRAAAPRRSLGGKLLLTECFLRTLWLPAVLFLDLQRSPAAFFADDLPTALAISLLPSFFWLALALQYRRREIASARVGQAD
jgi:hypothetical protein